ncbi:MAG TPA: chorismate lyase [Cellvibrionaceae bacterium]
MRPVSPAITSPHGRRGLGPWFEVNNANRARLPKPWQPWLMDDSSLTAKLRRKSAGDFNVEILGQYPGRPNLSEAHRLGISPRLVCIIREVLLKGRGGAPWVFARSVFPIHSLTGKLRHLARLDNRPLGAYLFSHSTLTRSAIEVAPIAPDGAMVPKSVQNSNILWGRRSIFYLHNKPLLVNEIFLPALLEADTYEQNHN